MRIFTCKNGIPVHVTIVRFLELLTIRNKKNELAILDYFYLHKNDI
jgi:hypothetical protein